MLRPIQRTRKKSRASDSPLQRRGELRAPQRPQRAIELYEPSELSPFTAAHQLVGEWRRWREALEENAVDTPGQLRAPGAVVVLEALEGWGRPQPPLIIALTDLVGPLAIDVDNTTTPAAIYLRAASRGTTDYGDWVGPLSLSDAADVTLTTGHGETLRLELSGGDVDEFEGITFARFSIRPVSARRKLLAPA